LALKAAPGICRDWTTDAAGMGERFQHAAWLKPLPGRSARRTLRERGRARREMELRRACRRLSIFGLRGPCGGSSGTGRDPGARMAWCVQRRADTALDGSLERIPAWHLWVAPPKVGRNPKRRHAPASKFPATLRLGANLVENKLVILMLPWHSKCVTFGRSGRDGWPPPESQHRGKPYRAGSGGVTSICLSGKKKQPVVSTKP